MDRTYRERCRIRKDLIQRERYDVLAVNPKAIPAVLEFYQWLTTIYLPRRFPTLFTPTSTSLRNNVTPQLLPIQPSKAETALQVLGENVDDEFLFLLKSDIPEDEGKYRMEAFINCFPSGFNTRSKLGLLLSDIHIPVPSYKAKLEKSMDRFFASLPIGETSATTVPA